MFSLIIVAPIVPLVVQVILLAASILYFGRLLTLFELDYFLAIFANYFFRYYTLALKMAERSVLQPGAGFQSCQVVLFFLHFLFPLH